jgi:16S rRNA (guanine(966)-N(2))-methyltransferase RsmD
MRIIGGRYRGRRIAMPRDIRPTKDKVREAIFNIVAESIKGSRVLDLFAGSGGLGLEALSRGASYVAFVDNSRICTVIIDKNLKITAEEDGQYAEILTKDAFAAIKALYGRKEKFDIIFLDPPYYKNLIRKCLKNISVYDILTPSGFIIAEHFKKDEPPQAIEGLKLFRQKTYGDTVISMYKREDSR